MKAAVVREFGQAPVYTDVADPVPADGTVVGVVQAAALTNLTRMLVAGNHYGSADLVPPVVAGYDGVVALPDGRRGYATALPGHGMLAERALVNLAALLEIPENLDAVTAAAAPNPSMSAWLALRDGAQLAPGANLLVLGATGVTGALAVQLAKRDFGAARVVAAGRDPDRLAWLRTVGADAVITLGADELGPAVAQAHRQRPFDAVLDYLWGEPAEQVLAALGNTGLGGAYHPVRFVQIGQMAGPRIGLDAGLLRSTAITLSGIGIGSIAPAAWAAARTEFLPALFAALAAGELQLATRAEPLAEVETVWSRREPSGTRVVFVP